CARASCPGPVRVRLAACYRPRESQLETAFFRDPKLHYSNLAPIELTQARAPGRRYATPFLSAFGLFSSEFLLFPAAERPTQCGPTGNKRPVESEPWPRDSRTLWL